MAKNLGEASGLLAAANKAISDANITVTAEFEYGGERCSLGMLLVGDPEADIRNFRSLHRAIVLTYLNTIKHPLITDLK